MKRVKPSDQPARIAIYGNPKKGKTRLATSLPWGKFWGEKAAYVAWDDGSENLTSTLAENASHIEIIKPAEKEDARTKKSFFDPLAEAAEIASFDWQSEGFGTIIWDTMTTTAVDILGAAAAAGKYGNNISMGTPGKDDYVPQPTMGDYGAAQRCTQHILDFLFNQPINVIVLFHEQDDDGGGNAEMVGGPATVGRAGIRPIAGRFEDLYRVVGDRVRVGSSVPPKYETKRVVYTDQCGYWLVGIRVPSEQNPIARVELQPNPVHFWNSWMEAVLPNRGAK